MPRSVTSGGSTRRNFMATSAVAFAGTALVGATPTAVHAGGGDTLKIALVGCGSRGAGAAVQALCTKGSVKLWAMADAFSAPLERCLTNLQRGLEASYDRAATAGLGDRIDVPKERRFVGLDAYRHAIDSGVDVVILTEPPGFRPRHLRYAVAADKHVFMEKPVATDVVGVHRVLEAAELAKQKGLKIGVGLQRRHQTSYLEGVSRIHDGEIGQLVLMRCYWNGGMPAKTPTPRGDSTELEHQVRNWYFYTWLSGDHICEQHVHNLDVCNWVKQEHPIEAKGVGGRQVRTGKEYGNIFDHHAVEFTYADGTKLFSQCRQIPGCDSRVAESLHGTRSIADFIGPRATFKTNGKIIWRSGRPAPGVNPYQTEHDALFDAIRNSQPHNEAEYGAHSTMTAILGRMATYSGKAVTWDAAFQSAQKLTTDAETWDAEPPILPNSDGSYPVAIPGRTKIV